MLLRPLACVLAIVLFAGRAEAQFYTGEPDTKSWVSYDVYGGHRFEFWNCVQEHQLEGKSEDAINAVCRETRRELDWLISDYNLCLDRLLAEHKIPELAYPGYADPELKLHDTRAHIAERLAYDLGLIDEVRRNCLPAPK